MSANVEYRIVGDILTEIDSTLDEPFPEIMNYRLTMHGTISPETSDDIDMNTMTAIIDSTRYSMTELNVDDAPRALVIERASLHVSAGDQVTVIAGGVSTLHERVVSGSQLITRSIDRSTTLHVELVHHFEGERAFQWVTKSRIVAVNGALVIVIE
jgi:plastocyanin